MKRALLNAANRKLCGGILRRAGLDVQEAASADEGITMALASAFDLVVIDIQLPGMDGLTATRVLRANASTAEVPILAVTAYAMRGDEARILEAGCDSYVAKPIRYQELLTAVERLVGSTGGER